MVRSVQNINSMTISVMTKDGKYFSRADVPESPFGEHERVVSFWDGNNLKVIPMENVKHIMMHFEENA